MSQHGQTQHGQTQHGRTQRLELADSNVRAWEAEVLAIDPELGIVLDRSAFYPGGGGQPPDHGVLLWLVSKPK